MTYMVQLCFLCGDMNILYIKHIFKILFKSQPLFAADLCESASLQIRLLADAALTNTVVVDFNVLKFITFGIMSVLIVCFNYYMIYLLEHCLRKRLTSLQ